MTSDVRIAELERELKALKRERARIARSASMKAAWARPEVKAKLKAALARPPIRNRRRAEDGTFQAVRD